VSCGDQELRGHIWSVRSTGTRTSPLRCSAAVGLVAKLSRRPVPAGRRAYPGSLYRAQSATGIRCVGGPAAGKPPETITCASTKGKRRRTIRATCEWCRDLFDGIVVRGPVDTSQGGPVDPPVLARFPTLHCAKSRSVFSATASRNGMTLELGIGGYRGPAFDDGVYSVPYGQILTTITFEGAGGLYANAHLPPNWEPGGPSGFITFGEDARGLATDRFFGVSMFVLNAAKSHGVSVGGRAVCKYR
jgi:hypothetical protein